MKIEKFVLGNLRSNCYIVYENNACIVVDPGYESQDVVSFIQSNALRVEAIYLTHGHYDHIGGSNQLRSLFDTHVYAPKKDAMFFEVGPYNKLGFQVEVDHWVSKNDQFDWLGQTFEVFETPGHSPGGSILATEHVIFSGDTLFFQSIGRTDLPLSSSQDIYQSVKFLYKQFDDDVVVYPGHGRSTTIKHEKKHNPFIRA